MNGVSPGESPTHASWLARQLGREAGEAGEWPDLLLGSAGRRASCGTSPGPAALERANLVALAQLVVKAVVDSSLRTGRQLDQDSVPLKQLFLLLDLCLRHGLRPRSRLLGGGRRDLWEPLQQLERFDPAAAAITATARQLSTVRTPGGRARAWLRLATMQKKLADYVKLLVEHQALAAEHYEGEALVCCEEGTLLCGLLVSLNIVDCNLCLKEEDLDGQEGVIDLTYYLRRKEDIGREDSADQLEEKDINTVIDQKNYIEEMNRNLTANVMNLQARVESLSNTNALMTEDLAITKRTVTALKQENSSLHLELEKQTNMANLSKVMKTEVERYSELDTKEESDMETKLREEVKIKQDLEKELRLEVQMKAEMEMAMKLLEKDVHEKQDTIISLRSQLDDIKSINLEMHTKLAQSEKSLSYKTNLCQRLETKSLAMADTMKQLDEKFVESEQNYQQSRTLSLELRSQVGLAEARATEFESDVKIEREWRERLQEASLADRDTLARLRQDNTFLKQVSGDYENLRADNERLQARVREGEQTLEELGQQLSWSKLQVTSMKEESSAVAGEWEQDSTATQCRICSKEFGLSRRRHHCRNCGAIFCDQCSDNKMKLPSSAKPVRVCDNCYTVLLDRQSKLI